MSENVILNFGAHDPFGEDVGEGGEFAKKIHIRVKQRNGRKCVTSIEGLELVKDAVLIDDRAKSKSKKEKEDKKPKEVKKSSKKSKDEKEPKEKDERDDFESEEEEVESEEDIIFKKWLKKTSRDLMQELSVGGGKVNADDNGDPVIQFQGNKPRESRDFLLKLKFRHSKTKIDRTQIEIHDF